MGRGGYPTEGSHIRIGGAKAKRLRNSRLSPVHVNNIDFRSTETLKQRSEMGMRQFRGRTVFPHQQLVADNLAAVNHDMLCDDVLLFFGYEPPALRDSGFRVEHNVKSVKEVV